MAYQAKRRKLYEEEFQLVEENGTVVHTLQVQMDADSMLRKLSEKHLALLEAMVKVRNIQTASTEVEKLEGIEILGSAVMDMVEAVFGKEDAEIIAEFYDNRYLEVCQEVVPFILDTVVPRVKEITKVNKRKRLSFYNRKK